MTTFWSGSRYPTPDGRTRRRLPRQSHFLLSNGALGGAAAGQSGQGAADDTGQRSADAEDVTDGGERVGGAGAVAGGRDPRGVWMLCAPFVWHDGTHTHTHTYMYIYIHIYTYIHIYIERERESECV